MLCSQTAVQDKIRNIPLESLNWNLMFQFEGKTNRQNQRLPGSAISSVETPSGLDPGS